jgi:hypothetical protein
MNAASKPAFEAAAWSSLPFRFGFCLSQAPQFCTSAEFVERDQEQSHKRATHRFLAKVPYLLAPPPQVLSMTCRGFCCSPVSLVCISPTFADDLADIDL